MNSIGATVIRISPTIKELDKLLLADDMVARRPRIVNIVPKISPTTNTSNAVIDKMIIQLEYKLRLIRTIESRNSFGLIIPFNWAGYVVSNSSLLHPSEKYHHENHVHPNQTTSLTSNQ